MSNLTRSNIAYDLNISPHELVVNYPDGNIKFIFSSELYRNNFASRIKEHRGKINQSLTKRFGFNIKSDKLSDLKLYTTIEKRGFLVYHNEVKIECLNNITLDGNNLTMNS